MSTLTEKDFIKPNWPAPSHIQAFSSTRHHGISLPPFDSLNLGAHVGDNLINVAHNRQLIQNFLKLEKSPLWLNQVHGSHVIKSQRYTHNCNADAIVSAQPQTPLIIMTADCLPILLCDKQGSSIAAIHAGWKSLHLGIITNTIEQLNIKSEDCLAWLGPCISQTHFEIGHEVKDKFCLQNETHENAFAFNQNTQKYHGCLKTIAKNELQTLGIEACYQTNLCTYENTNDFFSYRRQAITGRMATFIWMDTTL